MTVGKSGELQMICGGVPDLCITAFWEERVDASADTSAIAVTAMTVTAGETGRYTLDGTVSMDGAVLGRLTDCTAEPAEAGAAAAVSGACFPVVGAAIPHKERETVTITVQLAGQAPNGQRYHASGRISTALTLQPRISQVAASAQFIGSSMSVGILPADSKAVHTLRYEFAGVSGVIASNLMGGSHIWTPPMELCAAIPNSGKGDCEILCDTYMDGVLVGTASCMVTLWVPVQVGLELEAGWVDLEPANENTAAEGMDCFVQGISRVRGVFDESKINTDYGYGAIPAAIDITVGDVRYEAPHVSDVLRSYGSVPVICGLVDSRGRRYETTLQINVLPYAPPVFGDVRVFRCNGDGAADEYGDCLSVAAGFRVSGLDGANQGDVTAKLRVVGGEWSEAVTITDSASAVLWAGKISPNDTYEVLLDVVDTVGGSASMSVTLPCTNVFFHGRKGGCGAAFGKRAEEDDVLEVAWNLKTKGDLVVEGSVTIGGKALWEQLYPVGAVCSCGASIDPAALFGGVWEETTGARHWVRTA